MGCVIARGPSRVSCQSPLGPAAGDRIAGVFERDSANHQGIVEAEVQPGSAMYLERGNVAKARNIGSQSFHEIVVELKD